MFDGIMISEVVLGLVILAVLVPVAWIVGRRFWLSRRGWVFECSLRNDTTPRALWALGVARISGDTLEWYRMLSLSPRPAYAWVRGSVHLSGTRPVEANERVVLRDHDRVAELSTAEGAFALAVNPENLTALLSWLEAAPPGFSYQ